MKTKDYWNFKYVFWIILTLIFLQSNPWQRSGSSRTFWPQSRGKKQKKKWQKGKKAFAHRCFKTSHHWGKHFLILLGGPTHSSLWYSCTTPPLFSRLSLISLPLGHQTPCFSRVLGLAHGVPQPTLPNSPPVSVYTNWQTWSKHD